MGFQDKQVGSGHQVDRRVPVWAVAEPWNGDTAQQQRGVHVIPATAQQQQQQQCKSDVLQE